MVTYLYRSEMEGEMMYNILATVFKYIFILIIYLFIFSIIRMIYLDIRGMRGVGDPKAAYLKLVNKADTISFKIDEYYIIEDEILLGRHRNNDIIIKDPFVSKEHFRIIKDGDQYFLEDLGSANGTLVNQKKIEDVRKLKNGDIIQVGQIQFLFVNRK